jgi:AraC family transcriptional regulator
MPGKPKILLCNEFALIGKKVSMSITNNKTVELWQGFMPEKHTIKNTEGSELFSIEVYNSLDYFKNFDPTREFEKWAAVKVTDHLDIPVGMEPLLIPEGLFAVFSHKGLAKDVWKTYQYIYVTWIPNSDYILDARPHFAIMGEKYKRDDPASEEELYIPIRK